jgi:hypothetical protein
MDLDLYLPERETDGELRERLLTIAVNGEAAHIYQSNGEALDRVAKTYGLVRCGGEPVLVF